ncbi:MAG: hypothetical protein QM770_23230 [Tepidisphaeraceae bacterium]
MIRSIPALLASVALLAFTTTVHADPAKDAFDQGQTLVAKADFEQALKALTAAAQADPTNDAYAKRQAAVAQVVDYRALMDSTTDLKKYESMGRALRSFYLREKLNDEALKLAAAMNERLVTSGSLVLLAETQLACDKNEDAVKTLLAIPAEGRSPSAQALLAIGYVATGKLDDAKAVMAELTLPENAVPGAKYMAARAYAQTGDPAKAMAMLTACFESVPATQLDALKAQAKALPEFASIAGTPEFAAVLKTESKVKVSACTGGSDCSTCPQGTKCESEKK